MLTNEFDYTTCPAQYMTIPTTQEKLKYHTNPTQEVPTQVVSLITNPYNSKPVPYTKNPLWQYHCCPCYPDTTSP